jgi:hypothetical protein
VRMVAPAFDRIFEMAGKEGEKLVTGGKFE